MIAKSTKTTSCVITRKLDSKGRLLIPAEVLAQTAIDPAGEVYFDITKGGCLVIRPVKSETAIPDKPAEPAGGDN